jgi:hypothetical protein
MLCFCAILLALADTAAADTSAPAPPGDLLEGLAAALPGRYDSHTQKLAEDAVGTRAEDVHGRVYRSITPIDAPAISEHVFVNTVVYGGPDGSFDDAEFQVWILDIDHDRHAVVITPMKFSEPDRFKATAENAESFAGLAPSDLRPSDGSVACEIIWRAAGDDYLGISGEAPCVSMSYTMNKPLAWEWRYYLDRDALWITYAGRDDSGDIVNGRPDQLPWRLERIRD